MHFQSFFPSTMVMGPAAERRRDDLLARPAESQRTRRAVLVGTSDDHVRSLLTDVLRDIHVEVELAGEATEAEAVLAMIERVEGVTVISEAKQRFPGAPIVAILPLGTHRLATRAIAAGAQACYLLDMPIDRLRGLLNALLREPAPRVAEKRRAPRAATAPSTGKLPVR